MKRTGFVRGLIIGLCFLAINLVYVAFNHAPATASEWALHVSNGIFLIGLLLLILGVSMFTRLFSYRRRMQLLNITALYRSKTREEYQEVLAEDEERNERDTEELQEEGRDITFLVAALFLIVLSILLTINQVK